MTFCYLNLIQTNYYISQTALPDEPYVKFISQNELLSFKNKSRLFKTNRLDKSKNPLPAVAALPVHPLRIQAKSGHQAGAAHRGRFEVCGADAPARLCRCRAANQSQNRAD